MSHGKLLVLNLVTSMESTLSLDLLQPTELFDSQITSNPDSRQCHPIHSPTFALSHPVSPMRYIPRLSGPGG